MKTRSLVVLAVVLLATSGCSFHDALFSVFGDSYSGGGTTRAEKKAHYNAEIERWGD